MKKQANSNSPRAGLLAASLAAAVCGTTSCGGRSELYVGDETNQSDTTQQDACSGYVEPDFQGMLDLHTSEAGGELCELTRKYQWQILCHLDRPWETEVSENWFAAKNDLGGMLYESDTYRTAALEGEINCFKNTGLIQTQSGLEDVIINTSCQYVAPGGTISFSNVIHGEHFGTVLGSMDSNKFLKVFVDLDNIDGTDVNGPAEKFGYAYPIPSIIDNDGITAYAGTHPEAAGVSKSCSGEISDETYNELASKMTTVAEDLIERE